VENVRGFTWVLSFPLKHLVLGYETAYIGTLSFPLKHFLPLISIKTLSFSPFLGKKKDRPPVRASGGGLIFVKYPQGFV
jgi:hypothetical protein